MTELSPVPQLVDATAVSTLWHAILPSESLGGSGTFAPDTFVLKGRHFAAIRGREERKGV